MDFPTHNPTEATMQATLSTIDTARELERIADTLSGYRMAVIDHGDARNGRDTLVATVAGISRQVRLAGELLTGGFALSDAADLLPHALRLVGQAHDIHPATRNTFDGMAHDIGRIRRELLGY